MEQSIYNIVINTAPHEHTIYNTLNRALVVLDDDAFRTYEVGEGSHADALVKAGVLVENARHQQDVQEKAFDHDRFTNDWFALCICPTYECNYACPYCYEHGCTTSGIISKDVIDATYGFFKKIYARDGFKHFSLDWYGGEPTLCIDIMEQMTGWFRAFCDERGIDMTVGILSNCGVIDERLAQRMAAMGVQHLMPTIDGCEELHNKRRVNKSHGNSFQNTLKGVRNCISCGIDVSANMNTDKINFKEFRQLRKQLHDEIGLNMWPSLLKDYRQDYNANDTGFDDSAFDLYTREEYAWDLLELFRETPYSKDVFKGMFRPVRNFCRGQLENYYVIDPKGDVYKCEGWVGQKEHAFFNLLDLPSLDGMALTDYNPLRDPQCRDCAVLPLCKGQCHWDRALLDHACHVAAFTMPEYVRDFRSCYGDAIESVTVFEEPHDYEAELAEHFVCDGPNESRWAGIPWYETDEGGEAIYPKGKFWRKKMVESESFSCDEKISVA